MEFIAESNHIEIRNLQIEDVQLFARWWNNGELMASVGFKNGLGVKEETLYERFSNQITDRNNPLRNRRLYVVVEKETGRSIGELAYGEFDLGQKTCRIGMKICEISYQGRGLGKESLITFMNYLYKTLDLEIIYIDTLADNERALSLYRKVGFVETKTVKDFWVDPEGISHDVIFMELYRKDLKL